jgi:hypothetical protein
MLQNVVEMFGKKQKKKWQRNSAAKKAIGKHLYE